jgi:hypothetical protein
VCLAADAASYNVLQTTSWARRYLIGIIVMIAILTYAAGHFERLVGVGVELHIAIFVVVHLYKQVWLDSHRIASYRIVSYRIAYLDLDVAAHLNVASDRARVHRAPSSVPNNHRCARALVIYSLTFYNPRRRRPTHRLAHQKLFGLYFDD